MVVFANDVNQKRQLYVRIILYNIHELCICHYRKMERLPKPSINYGHMGYLKIGPH